MGQAHLSPSASESLWVTPVSVTFWLLARKAEITVTSHCPQGGFRNEWSNLTLALLCLFDTQDGVLESCNVLASLQTHAGICKVVLSFFSKTWNLTGKTLPFWKIKRTPPPHCIHNFSFPEPTFVQWSVFCHGRDRRTYVHSRSCAQQLLKDNKC